MDRDNILLSQMRAHADPSQVAGLSRFFKTGPGQYGEGDRFLGIKVPVTRAVVKACWKEVGIPELEACISSEYHEVRLAALLALVEQFRHARKDPPFQRACIDFYLAHTDRINNWDLVDLSCYPRTLWEQRIGIVSTMSFIRHGQLADTFALADILLHHPHDLIHKAVGWLLREAGKRDKAALEAWLAGVSAANPAEGPRCRTMPRTMLRYAIEKFPENERTNYMARS